MPELQRQLDSRYIHNGKLTPVLSVLPEEDWATLDEIKRDYNDLVNNPGHRSSVKRMLQDLEHLGEVETKNDHRGKHPKKFRKADRPVKEVRDKPIHPQTEGLPDWMERRLQEYVERKARELFQEHADYFIEQVLNNHREALELEKEEKKVGNSNSQYSDVQQHLKQIIQDKEDAKATEIYEELQDRADDVPSKRTMRRKLRNLAAKGFIETEGAKKGKVYKAAT